MEVDGDENRVKKSVQPGRGFGGGGDHEKTKKRVRKGGRKRLEKREKEGAVAAT
jgi:hypothetical protein